MTRIAILGGGISGLTAAYELELARKRGAPIDWHLYEAADRLGGIIETTRHSTPEGEYILEGGPDAWVTEKPWATELAIELGLEDQLIYSNDATRKTYILRNHQLLPIPDRMRLMVPEDLSALDDSPLFSTSAKAAYARELARADELRAAAPTTDGSIASFVRRHFGDEVLTTLAAPLLSGVFGGDVHKLSVRAVMPQFVAMEREHGSLILALQQRQKNLSPQPIFTSLHNGMGSLIEALISMLPNERLHTTHNIEHIGDLRSDHTLLAASLDATRTLLQPLDVDAAELLPTEASSAILVSLAWSPSVARTFTLSPGFGFLVPPLHSDRRHPKRSEGPPHFARGGEKLQLPTESEPRLLACTFVDQKFPHRAPANARILRAFFGGPTADALASQPNATITHAAITQLRTVLGPIPEPAFTTIRRLPRSLPQYEIGHLDRMAELEALISQTPGLHLLGNSYRGVGLPDLIRDARTTARQLITSLSTHD
ncbi:MAG TPA: protoporphyrinogen oxidase [Acidobacteriaceae bacterium]|jgi:oxygen-dependent protoporphyrinogen oxidase|nr:protoporphyrinogen oxidase [Acidobacteriaceae bacterium]